MQGSSRCPCKPNDSSCSHNFSRAQPNAYVCVLLQVLLDMLRQEELSDFLRLMCRSLKTHTCTPADEPDARPHTANSSSSAASASKQRPSSSSATVTEERPASPGRLQALGKWRLAVASATGGGLKQAAAGA
jgi:hypothetical protein